MSFSVNDFNIALCSGNNVLIYNLESRTENVIALPKLEGEKEIRAHNREDIESFHTLTSVAFSNDGQYFFVCSNRKQLCVYKTKNLELVSNRTMCRAASKVRFLPNNDIVVADKTGDAYLFSMSTPTEKEQLLLGHLSMLLDILVTDDQKYVISADRDEKIRVSMFPNSYNIVSYCLGHKNFVTNINILPHDKSILVSSGGDGTLIFWDFENGKELLTVYFHEKLSQDDLLKVNQTLKENDLDEQVSVSPVKDLRMSQINEESSVISVTLFCSNVILNYIVSRRQNDLDVKYLDLIKLEEEPLECQYHKNQLWILTETKVLIYTFNGQSFIIDENFNSKTEIITEMWKKVHSVSVKTLLPVLYKRKFDNVQEYQERKKSRLTK